MNYGTSEIDQTPRRDTIREAIGIIVSTLEKEDSQAIHEQEEEGGGLRTVKNFFKKKNCNHFI